MIYGHELVEGPSDEGEHSKYMQIAVSRAFERPPEKLTCGAKRGRERQKEKLNHKEDGDM